MTRRTATPARSLSVANGACRWGLTVWLILTAATAVAVDGRVELHSTHQEGRSGALAYQTDTLREVYSLGQYTRLGRNLFLNVEAFVRRESLESRNTLATAETDKTTMLPHFSLTYRATDLRLGLSGRATRIEQVRTGSPDQRDESFDLNFWLNSDLGAVKIDGSAQESASWRYSEGGDRENREHSLTGNVLWEATDNDQFIYRVSRSRQDAVNQNLQTTFLTNNLQYRGNHGFNDDRGHFSVHALANHFRQRNHRDNEFNRAYVLPLFGGFTLDDTPEFLDPLEEDPIAVAGLLDNDRTTPTQIDLGDDAPLVREYGGDYRNIMVDFGEPQEMIAIDLYVDRIVTFPDLMQWRIYVSDDPEGRDWGDALSLASYTIRYFELETGRQGWAVTFDSPLTHRRIKMVDFKLGPGEPNLFVTEMEVYRESVTTTPDTESTVLNGRLNTQVDYQLTDRLGARYSLNLNERRFDDDDRNLRGLAQVGGLDYRLGTWVAMAQYETHYLRGRTRQDTESNSQIVSLSRTGPHRVLTRLTYNRTVDNSFINQNVTQSVSGTVTWRIAPLLTFTQKVSYGLRDDPLLADPSRSWVLVSELRGTPRPNVTFELRRADRWVDQEAGAGFTPFNDTELLLNWTILPLVQLSSLGTYQQREEDDWFYRNTLSWSPIQGGSMQFRFFVTDQQDTRTDYWQRGGGAGTTWRPRPTLRLSASLEKSRVRQFEDRNDPLSYQLRGSWTF